MSEVRCTCDYWNDGGPDVECPLHGECASYGHVGYCDGCPDDAQDGAR